VLNWAAVGKIKPAIHQTFPLERTPDAFTALRSRTILGKIVVSA